MGYLGWKFNNPLAFSAVQKYWFKPGISGFIHNFSPFIHGHILSAPYALKIIETIYTLVFAGAAIYLWLRLNKQWSLYCMAAIIIPLTTGVSTSMNRYTLVLFPCYIAIAKLLPKNLIAPTMAVLGAGLSLFTYLYINSNVFLA